MNKLISFLYKLARTLSDIKTVSSGSPAKIARRGKNKIIGRKLEEEFRSFHFNKERG